MIYHLTTRKEWKRALATGDYRTKDLEHEGFIHCSTITQMVPVAAHIFPRKRKLTVLVIDESRLTPQLKLEKPSDGTYPPGVPAGEKFPHVYGAINLDAVVKTPDMERDANDLFILPENL